MMIKAESHNWSTRNKTVECSALNEKSISHPLLPRLRDHWERGLKDCKPEVVEDYKEIMSSGYTRAPARRKSEQL